MREREGHARSVTVGNPLMCSLCLQLNTQAILFYFHLQQIHNNDGCMGSRVASHLQDSWFHFFPCSICVLITQVQLHNNNYPLRIAFIWLFQSPPPPHTVQKIQKNSRVCDCACECVTSIPSRVSPAFCSR